jgi:hypothetical protein
LTSNLLCLVAAAAFGGAFAPVSAFLLPFAAVWGFVKWLTDESLAGRALGRSLLIGCVLGLIYPFAIATQW